jgi:phosphoribosylaminoimidazole carboxylase PurE protein
MDNFRESVEKGLGAVVILAGSGSDGAHVEKIHDAVQKYGLPVEARVASAHKQSEEVLALINLYDSFKGPLLYIAVAGGTDALSGTASWVTNRPVLTCPPDHPNQSGLTNPPGSSNAYVGRADNAARFAAQMFSYINPECRAVLEKDRAKKIDGQKEYDSRFQVGTFKPMEKK